MLLAVGLALALAGCGGDGGAGTTTGTTTAPPTTTTAADPGREVIARFLEAARDADVEGLRGLMSPETLERFQGRFQALVGELQEGVGAIQDYRIVVSERITEEFGVVAIDGRTNAEGTRARQAYAVPLRLVGEEWRVELGGPLSAEPIGPDPEVTEPIVAQVAAAVRGRGGAATAVMWIDGHTVNPEIRGTSTNVTMFVNLDPPLDPGRHTAVVFASGGRTAAATAWGFRVRR